MTHNIERRGILKHGLIAALIATVSISVLVSTTNTSTAGAKNIQTPANAEYTKVSNNPGKTRGKSPYSDNWGDICNNYGPAGSINYHGYGVPKECFNGDTYNPFSTIYDKK